MQSYGSSRAVFDLGVAPAVGKAEVVAARYLGDTASHGCTLASRALSNVSAALFRAANPSIDTESARRGKGARFSASPTADTSLRRPRPALQRWSTSRRRPRSWPTQ